MNTDNTFSVDGRKRTKACKNKECGHNSRDHNLSKKKNGIWTGKCTVPDCVCKEYEPEIKLSIR